MNLHQTPYLKHFMAMLFLLAGLSSQPQIVFACDLMDEQPQTSCCCGEDMASGCEMGGGCNMEGEIALNPDCCDLSVDSLSDITLGSPGSTSNLVALQNAAQPPPLTICSVTSRPQLEFASNSFPFYYHADQHFKRSEVYLVTKRLRI